jgi:putative resolvase
VTEIASGLNDQRPKLGKLLADSSIGTIVVENRDRLTRFGSHYIETRLEAQGRHLEILFQRELGDDFVRVITSIAARIYGRRHSKRRDEKIKACVERIMSEEEE